MDFKEIWTGEIFGYNAEENRQKLLEDIKNNLESSSENNMKIIKAEVDKYNSRQVDFSFGPKNVFIICGLNNWDDYYYLYYDPEKDYLGCNTGVDGIIGFSKENKKIKITIEEINSRIYNYLEENKYYEVPFTNIYEIKKEEEI